MISRPLMGRLALRIGIVLVFAAAFLLGGCRQKNQYQAPPPPTVTVSRPLQQAVTHYAEFTGMTDAVESVDIRARVEGYLQSIHFTPGTWVEKGDLLFVIDPKPYQAKLDEAEADLLISQAELRLAEATLKRKENAYKKKAVSEVEVIEARAEKDKAKAAIAAAKAAIETARLNFSYTRISARISGRIGRDLVDTGNLVGASERTLLTTIVKDDPIYAYFNVNERDLLNGHQKSPQKQSPIACDAQTTVYLGLSTDAGYPYKGCVDYADNRVDEATGTLQVRGVFPNPDHVILPGLFARVRIPVGNNDKALLVPEKAVGTDQQGSYLLVVNDQNAVEYRLVKIGVRIDDMRVIEAGLKFDERVIVNGVQRARPGITVTPTEAKSSGSTPSPSPQPAA